MKTSLSVPKAAAALAVLIGAAFAFALPAGADVGILSPPVAAVQVGSPATLDARGAVITVEVTTVCAPGASFAYLALEVTQANGRDLARGYVEVPNIACTGTFNTTDVVVFANDHPFRRGPAFAKASFQVYDSTGYLSATDQREIRIVR